MRSGEKDKNNKYNNNQNGIEISSKKCDMMFTKVAIDYMRLSLSFSIQTLFFFLQIKFYFARIHTADTNKTHTTMIPKWLKNAVR